MSKPMTSSPPPADRKAVAGFTLLEVMVATALMGVAVIGLMSLVNRATANASSIRYYARAAMLARSQMNDLLTMEPLKVQAYGGTYGPDSGWQANVQPYQSAGRAVPGRSVLLQINLTVWWTDRGERHSISMNTLRRVRATPDLIREHFSSGFSGQLDPGLVR